MARIEEYREWQAQQAPPEEKNFCITPHGLRERELIVHLHQFDCLGTFTVIVHPPMVNFVK